MYRRSRDRQSTDRKWSPSPSILCIEFKSIHVSYSQPQMEKLITKNYFLNLSAKEAFKSYVRAYESHSLKHIYVFQKICRVQASDAGEEFESLLRSIYMCFKKMYRLQMLVRRLKVSWKLWLLPAHLLSQLADERLGLYNIQILFKYHTNIIQISYK